MPGAARARAKAPPMGRPDLPSSEKTQELMNETVDAVSDLMEKMSSSMATSMGNFRSSWFTSFQNAAAPPFGGAAAAAESPAAPAPEAANNGFFWQLPAANEAAAGSSAPSTRTASPAPSSAPSFAPESSRREDDGTMKRHCASIERLVVDIGLCPQAARVALRHLDAWLVSDGGRAELAVAEAAAHAEGDLLVHIGDRVRLEGLQRNKEVNGHKGTLISYKAESMKWKVRLDDGQIFWVRPQLMKPLEMKRLPLAGAEQPSEPRADAKAPDVPPESIQLASAWAKLEARQLAWKEEKEAREIELLEREMQLHRQTEALEAQQESLQERRQGLLSQARAVAEMQRKAPPEEERREYFLDDKKSLGDSIEKSDQERSLSSSALDEQDNDQANDDMWETDWTKLTPAEVVTKKSSGQGRRRNWSGRKTSSRTPSRSPDGSPAVTPRAPLAKPEAPSEAALASVPESPNGRSAAEEPRQRADTEEDAAE